MIKVSVLNLTGENKKFDMEYYCNTRLPLVSGTLGNALNESGYDKDPGGGAPGIPAPFIAIANLNFNSMEEFGQAFAAGAPALVGDLPNFTNMEPVVQISVEM